MRRSRQSEHAAKHVPQHEACQDTTFRSGISSNARRRVGRRREAVHEKVLELHGRREVARRRRKRTIRAGRRDGVKRGSEIRARGGATRVAQGLGVEGGSGSSRRRPCEEEDGGRRRSNGWKNFG
jgi:hypothetical protein